MIVSQHQIIITDKLDKLSDYYSLMVQTRQVNIITYLYTINRLYTKYISAVHFSYKIPQHLNTEIVICGNKYTGSQHVRYIST